MSTERSQSIVVCVRVRPINDRERKASAQEAWESNENTLMQTVFPKKGYPNGQPGAGTRETSCYPFDHVFPTESRSDDIFNTAVQDVIVAAMEGHHAAVFAYGQTSSGKTFTMQGTKTAPGIIPLSIEEVFLVIERTVDREFLLRVSYLEIYNEHIIDLLSPATNTTQIKIFDDAKKGVVVNGLKEEIVISPQQIFALISSGEAHRHVGATNYNAVSSRSHTIFRMVIESKKTEAKSGQRRSKKNSPILVSTLSLIDLAGSESVRLTRATGQRKKEGSYINKSLLTLGHVIWKLTDLSKGQKNTASGKVRTNHIPYRDSKLTRLLQPALGGNAQIAIVCTISSSVVCVEESNNTLKFATRAKRMIQHAGINEVLDDAALLAQYKQEITELKKQLELAKQQTTMQQGSPPRPPVTGTGENTGELEDVDTDAFVEDEENEEDREALEQAIAHLNRIILTSTSLSPTQKGRSPRRQGKQGAKKATKKKRKKGTKSPGKKKASQAGSGSSSSSVGKQSATAAAVGADQTAKDPAEAGEVEEAEASDVEVQAEAQENQMEAAGAQAFFDNENQLSPISHRFSPTHMQRTSDVDDDEEDEEEQDENSDVENTGKAATPESKSNQPNISKNTAAKTEASVSTLKGKKKKKGKGGKGKNKGKAVETDNMNSPAEKHGNLGNKNNSNSSSSNSNSGSSSKNNSSSGNSSGSSSSATTTADQKESTTSPITASSVSDQMAQLQDLQRQLHSSQKHGNTKKNKNKQPASKLSVMQQPQDDAGFDNEQEELEGDDFDSDLDMGAEDNDAETEQDQEENENENENYKHISHELVGIQEQLQHLLKKKNSSRKRRSSQKKSRQGKSQFGDSPVTPSTLTFQSSPAHPAHPSQAHVQGNLHALQQLNQSAARSVAGTPQRQNICTPSGQTNDPLIGTPQADQLAQMKADLDAQAMNLSWSQADSHFLQQQLAERDELLEEWGKAMEAVETRQAALERENEKLKKTTAELQAKMQEKEDENAELRKENMRIAALEAAEDK